MADLSSVTDNYLPTASETFTDNLSSSILAEATTVPVNSAVEYEDGATVVLTVEPGTANEATFVGKKDTGSNQFIECIWTEGNTAVGHDSGATIIDYDSATHYNLLSEALQLIMNQDGTLKDTPIRTALGLSDASNDGWEVFPYTMSVASGYNKGNNSFDLTVASQDVTSLLTPGMKLRLERGTTAPTQCADFTSGSSHNASLSSPSGTGLTTTATVEAWANPETRGAIMGILSHYSTYGFSLSILADGTVQFLADENSSTEDTNITLNSVPLNRWTHIAASHTVNSGGAIYFNGVSMSTTYTNGSVTTIQENGDLELGSITGASYFNGKLSDVRLWSDIRTATEIKDNMNQALTGSETGLVGYWKLDGDFTDETSNSNDLTANNGLVATTVDHIMQDTEYAIVTAVSYSAPNSTVTVFTGSDHTIPNMTLSSPHYSTQGSPYGFPRDNSKWTVETITTSIDTQSTPTQNAWYNLGGFKLQIPTGAWDITKKANASCIRTGQTVTVASTLSTANNTESDERFTSHSGYAENASSNRTAYGDHTRTAGVNLTTDTDYYMNISNPQSSATSIDLIGATVASRIIAESAYL